MNTKLTTDYKLPSLTLEGTKNGASLPTLPTAASDYIDGKEMVPHSLQRHIGHSFFLKIGAL